MTLCHFPEKLRVPITEDFDNLQSALDKFSDEMIEYISKPTSATEALKDEKRQKIIRHAFTELGKQIKFTDGDTTSNGQ